MKSLRPCRWLASGMIVVAVLSAGAQPLSASDEARKFLDGLRELMYFDTALEYLELMRTNPRADKAFRELIDYEAGVTLIDDSHMGRTTSIREKQLGKARERFNKFLAEHPKHHMASSANFKLADLLVERGRIKADQAAQSDNTAAEKTLFNAEARKLYLEAQKVFDTLEKRFLAEHKKFPKVIDRNDTEKIELRNQVRRNLLDSRLALATVVYQIARTYEPGTDGNKKNLADSAKKYEVLYEKYSEMLAGLYARMWEGRCYKELGKSKQAFEAFEEILEQPGEAPPFRVLRNKACVLSLETALMPKVKKYKESVALYQVWEKSARGDEENSIEGLAIKHLSAEAALAYAKSLTKKEDAKTRKANLVLAKKLFKNVSRHESEYQKKAKIALMDKLLGGTDEKVEPTNFAEARDRAQDELDRAQSPKLKPEEAAGARAEAVKYYRMALRMKTDEVSVDEINVIRYYLAYLYLISDEVHEAAVMGEFLARQYSDGVGGRQGAKIAMASYARMYNEVPSDEDSTFENDRMVGIAKYITERWPGESESDEAWMMLVRNAVISGNPKTALEYLSNVPVDSPRRSDAELMTGQALWGAYLKASRLPDDEKPSQAELDALVKHAQETLEAGVNRMRKSVDAGGKPTYTLVASALSLAQIYIGAGQSEKAVKWLDDPKIGPMTLVAAKHPVTDRGNFRIETYKAALRAYVSVQQLDKAEKTMNALEKSIGEGGSAKLTRIYISLGRQLEEQLKRLRTEGKNKEAAKVSRGFELFLARISERKEGNTFGSLNWVAETFSSLAAGMDTGQKKTLSKKTRAYYAKSADTYRRIIELCKSQKGFAPKAGAEIGIKVRLAKCLRRQGKNKDAMNILVDILKKKNMMVEAQVEAAYTYQSWGEKNPAAYELAIKGGRKAKKSDGSIVLIVWGWGKIAKMVVRSPKHKDVFHEARFNLAECRFKLAESRSGKERKTTLKQAEKDVVVIKQLYPEMGGQERYTQYDNLFKKIQKLQGVPVTGLKVVKKKKVK